MTFSVLAIPYPFLRILERDETTESVMDSLVHSYLVLLSLKNYKCSTLPSCVQSPYKCGLIAIEINLTKSPDSPCDDMSQTESKTKAHIQG